MNVLRHLGLHWHKNDGASNDAIRMVERNLHICLPPDYQDFLRWSDGGEGQVGTHYLSLWPTDEIVKLNDDYEIGNYLLGVIGIGTDGGGECYAFDYRKEQENPPFVRVPLADLCVESIVPLADTFWKWLEENLKPI
jgi:hypothetical protein